MYLKQNKVNLYCKISENTAVKIQGFLKNMLSCICRIIRMIVSKCHLEVKKIILKYGIYIKCRLLEGIIVTALMSKNSLLHTGNCFQFCPWRQMWTFHFIAWTCFFEESSINGSFYKHTVYYSSVKGLGIDYIDYNIDMIISGMF